MEKFKIHCVVKKVQSNPFEEPKQNLQHHEAVVQLDFAENYARMRFGVLIGVMTK